jgi:cytochrome P450
LIARPLNIEQPFIMAAYEELRAVSGASVPRRLLNVAALLLLVRFGLFLYNGWRVRMRFRKLQDDGVVRAYASLGARLQDAKTEQQQVVTPEHSLVFGHLMLLKRIRDLYPKDSASTYATRHIVMNWRQYFPGSNTCPSVIYLDFWPFSSEPVAIIMDPEMCQTVTADRFPIRHDQGKYLAWLMSGPRNLFAFDGDVHKKWRARLNPGFSARNLQQHIARGKMIDEVLTFAERIKKHAGADGQLGDVFQLFPLAIDLTFDIICRIVLWVCYAFSSRWVSDRELTSSCYRDFSPGEQINGPTEMQQAFRVISQHLVFKSWASLHKRLNPFWQLSLWRCHRTLRRVVLPHIQKHMTRHSLEKHSGPQKTVLDLALKEFELENPGVQPSGQLIEDIVGLTKQFLFAGHDTTAINMSFAYHFLNKNPDALARLRDEHDHVFGADPGKAAEVMRQSPHLLNFLPFTTAVVKETLRLCPVAASIRKGHRGYALRSNDGMEYPMDGFIITTGVACLHYSSEMFTRPTEFLPERWAAPAGDPLHIKDQAKYAWRPFEWGPMSCIGMELAMAELKMALVLTVREVEVVTALEEWDGLR